MINKTLHRKLDWATETPLKTERVNSVAGGAGSKTVNPFGF
jgi:hypothetical protein